LQPSWVAQLLMQVFGPVARTQRMPGLVQHAKLDAPLHTPSASCKPSQQSLNPDQHQLPHYGHRRVLTPQPTAMMAAVSLEDARQLASYAWARLLEGAPCRQGVIGQCSRAVEVGGQQAGEATTDHLQAEARTASLQRSATVRRMTTTAERSACTLDATWEQNPIQARTLTPCPSP